MVNFCYSVEPLHGESLCTVNSCLQYIISCFSIFFKLYGSVFGERIWIHKVAEYGSYLNIDPRHWFQHSRAALGFKKPGAERRLGSSTLHLVYKHQTVSLDFKEVNSSVVDPNTMVLDQDQDFGPIWIRIQVIILSILKEKVKTII